MQELQLQTKLREGGVDLLTSLTGPPYFLHVRRHKRYENLILFKYDQLNSPLSSPFVQQLRGVILDEADNWAIVSRPFDKFFNYGEFNAPTLDWKKVRIYEKCDGTMIQMYWYKDEWHVGTPGTPDASGCVGFDGAMTFEELFWRTWKKTGKGSLPSVRDSHLTFIFELMTPLNRVVVDHKEPRLTLIGVRSHESGEEYSPNHWKPYDPVHEYIDAPADQTMATAIEGMNKSFDSIDPLKQEGYVVVDRDFKRVKLKHPGYVKLHHMVSSTSEKSLMEIVRNGEACEVAASFPQFKEQFESLKKRHDAFVFVINFNYNINKDLVSQKDFAMAVHEMSFCQILFMMRAGGKTARECLKEIHLDRYKTLLEGFEKRRELYVG